jgi:hypothetical protein
MAKVTCPQPPTGKCTSTLVRFKGIEVTIRVCNIIFVEDTLVHHFNHDGVIHVAPNNCFQQPLDTKPHKTGYDTPEDKAIQPGIVFMLFEDMGDPTKPKYFLQALIILPKGCLGHALEILPEGVVQDALEDLSGAVEGWPEGL